jgi:phenylalanyl-tRNA synthetase alpha chain
MLNKINTIITEVENAIASSKEQVEEYRIKWLSKKGSIKSLFDEFKDVPNELKKEQDALNDLNKKTKEPKENKLPNDDNSSFVYGQIKSAYNNFIISPEAPLERIDSESGLPVYKGEWCFYFYQMIYYYYVL